jgi:DNA polymerase III sliding clamp (beta) subunit (PCNA family)
MPTCRKCGCTDARACKGGCYWVEPDLCNQCVTHVDDVDSLNPKSFTDKSALVKMLNENKYKNNNWSMKKITIPASPLMAVLKKVKEVIAKNAAMPILTNVLVKVRRTDILVIATDLALTIQGTIEVTNDHEFGYEYLLPFDFLYNICHLTNGLDITIEVTDTLKKKIAERKAVISTYTDIFNVYDLDNPEDFPKMPDFPHENSAGIAGDMIEWMNKLISTAAKDVARPAMQKIYLGINNEGMALATTDAHVLVEKTFKAESAQAVDILIDTKIAKALKGFRETSISWSDSHVAFVSNGITIIGTIQDEQYPQYRAVFPEEGKTNLRVSLDELTGVMERAALTRKSATIYFKREIGTLVIESTDVDYNRKVTSRLAADYFGDCVSIILSPEKLLLILGQVEYKSINLSITSPEKAVIITTDADESYRALIMPMIN